MKDVLAVVMAGGRGERLMPLTKHRSKPAIPFGGIYLLVDLTLSNCINSEIYKIIVLPQYMSHTLVEHLEAGWNIFSPDLGHFMRIAPPQMITGEKWYEGTADSIRQNAYLIEQAAPSQVLILSGDHVYKMDFKKFRDYHVAHKAHVTIAAHEAFSDQADQYGILEVNNRFRVKGFEEKPQAPKTIPGDSSHVLASMGVYIFDTEVLLDLLRKDSRADFGKHLLPDMTDSHRVFAYPYRRENKIRDKIFTVDKQGIRREQTVEVAKDSGYWRDVGTLDAYWNANMDLTGVDPHFNMYGAGWPIRTYQRQYPPVKTVFATEIPPQIRVGKVLDSLVAHGSIISGGLVRNSVLSYNVFVHSWSQVEESVVLENVDIGRHAQIKKAIIGENVRVPAHEKIGYNMAQDRQRFRVTRRGITVVAKEDFPA